MSKRTLGDTLFRAAVTVLAGGSLLAGVGVAMGMVDRFNYLRQNRAPPLEGQEGQQQ